VATTTPIGAIRAVAPCAATPFPVPITSTVRESLRAPSDDARQTCVVLGLGLLLAGINVLNGRL
jgi:hypothetical protein